MVKNSKNGPKWTKTVKNCQKRSKMVKYGSGAKDEVKRPKGPPARSRAPRLLVPKYLSEEKGWKESTRGVRGRLWGGHSSSSCLPQPVLSLRDHISYNSYISHSYFFEIFYIFLRPSSQRVFVATSWGQGPWKRDLRKRVVTSTAEIWCIPHTLEDKQEMEDWPNWIVGSPPCLAVIQSNQTSDHYCRLNSTHANV